MKLQQLFESSKAQQISNLSTYLNTRFPGKKEQREQLKAFCAWLFKDGWEYRWSEDLNTSFEKGTPKDGAHRLVLPERRWTAPNRGLLNYLYHRKMPGDATLFSNGSIMIGPLAAMQDRLKQLQDQPAFQLT